MNTLWIKIASGVIGILIIIVLVSMFMPSGEPEPAPTFTERVEEDKENFLVPPEQPDEPNQSLPTPVEIQPVPEAPKTNEITIYVKQLIGIEQTEAERELSYAVPMLSIGRLPVTSYKPMIDAARRIINRWPDSIYAYKAKQMLAELPESERQKNAITSQELDISMFSKPRTGTVPYKVPIEDR